MSDLETEHAQDLFEGQISELIKTLKSIDTTIKRQALIQELEALGNLDVLWESVRDRRLKILNDLGITR